MTSFDAEKRKLTGGTITDGLGRVLDPGLEPYIRAINQNPDIMTIQSCSGLPYSNHPGQGHPYVSLVFRGSKSRDHYLNKLRAVGYNVFPLTNDDGSTHSWYVEIAGTTGMATKQRLNEDPLKRAAELSEYYSPKRVQQIIKNGREAATKCRLATPQECRQFWNVVTAILKTPI